MGESNMKLAIDDESVNIYFDNGDDKDPTHVVYWHKDEWIEDPETVVPAIHRAIELFFTDKRKLLKLLGWTYLLDEVDF